MRRNHAFAGVVLSLLSLVSLPSCRSDAPPPTGSPAAEAKVEGNDEPRTEGVPLSIPRMTGAAIALTASDGTGLRLASIVARAVVDGPLALTELHLTFENPEDRVREGRFHITLPARATVSRFGMKVGDVWQEGEVVEKSRARAAYEDFLQRKQDPALLEQGDGNAFDARVFPIPARGRKELVISYGEELASSDVYAMPLAGLPEIGEVDLSIQSGRTTTRLARKAYTPDGDFGLPPRAESAGARSGNLVVVPVRVLERREAEPIASALVLVDTSASRALGFAAQLELVRSVIARLGDARICVAAFDQTAEVVFEGAATRFGAEHVARLDARGALGASDLERAFTFARREAARTGAQRLIFIGDGVATAGKTDPESLRGATDELARAGVTRIDAIAVGALRDVASLERLTRGGAPHAGVVIDGARGVDEIARRLGERALAGVPVRIDGARWSWPRTLEGVQSGDETLVYADVPDDRPVHVVVGDETLPEVAIRSVERPLLERAWVRAKIGSLLEAKTIANEAATRAEIVTLSTRHRVLSPYTSLLVLETENDYARFGIERTALADILTIDGGKIALVHRGAPAFAPRAADERAKGGKLGGSHTDPHVARAAALRDAAEFGMIGVLGAGAGGDPNAPTAPWGRDEAGGARFAVSGGDGVGLDSIGTIGHGAGTAARSGLGAGGPRPSASGRVATGSRAPTAEDAKITGVDPYTGKLKAVMDALARKSVPEALALARAWHDRDPGDVLALTALGEAFEASGDPGRAARAYGSILDLFSARADLRRFAAARLERISGLPEALELAVDAYEKAWIDRPDHPSSHHLFALALARKGELGRAFEVLVASLERTYPRFPGADRILREDLGLVAAAWRKIDPRRAAEIAERLAKAGVLLDTTPSLRFVLTWETDANDVDFHVEDGAGHHAYYAHRELEGGGELYADVTRGYGPECFTVAKDRSHRRSYALKAHYYARGPMGYGMGKVAIVEHDGRGGLRFEDRPFVVMTDRAYVDLGVAR